MALKFTNQKLLELLKEGLTIPEMSERLGVVYTAISKRLKKLGLQRNSGLKNRGRRCGKQAKSVDWKSIQEFYDCGNSWKGICEKFGITIGNIRGAVADKLFISRTPRESAIISLKKKTIWTKEKRVEVSKRMTKMYAEHPELHPCRKTCGNRNKMSKPERIVFDFLTSNSINFEHNKRVGRYWPDFLIGNTIIEVDGKPWHSGLRAEYDKKRDIQLTQMGYSVHRFDSILVSKNPSIVLSVLKV